MTFPSASSPHEADGDAQLKCSRKIAASLRKRPGQQIASKGEVLGEAKSSQLKRKFASELVDRQIYVLERCCVNFKEVVRKAPGQVIFREIPAYRESSDESCLLASRGTVKLHVQDF